MEPITEQEIEAFREPLSTIHVAEWDWNEVRKKYRQSPSDSNYTV